MIPIFLSLRVTFFLPFFLFGAIVSLHTFEGNVQNDKNMVLKMF